MGDQRHGTNVEAPLTTIQDAVRNVMGENSSDMSPEVVQLLQRLIAVVESKNVSISKRDVAFTAFVPMGISKIKPPYGVFYIYSMGVVTNRDAWVINYSADRVNSNVNRCVLFFEEQLVRWIQSDSSLDIDDFVGSPNIAVFLPVPLVEVLLLFLLFLFLLFAIVVKNAE